MKYNDGVALDDNMRVTICPRCQNEEFSDDAMHCRICGLMLFNECEGGDNYNGAFEHRNPGNARFCEFCGARTRFFIDGLLKSWEELTGNKTNPNKSAAAKPVVQSPVMDVIDDDDLPF